MELLTVDGNGDGLREDEAISTLERGYLAELVELQVLSADAVGRDGLDEFNVEAILLCDSEQASGARVALQDTY